MLSVLLGIIILAIIAFVNFHQNRDTSYIYHTNDNRVFIELNNFYECTLGKDKMFTVMFYGRCSGIENILCLYKGTAQEWSIHLENGYIPMQSVSLTFPYKKYREIKW